MGAPRNWSKSKPKLDAKARAHAAKLLASGLHREDVQKLLGVNEGTLYRAVPKAMVDEARAQRQAKGLSVAKSTKPRSGRPPKPEQAALARKYRAANKKAPLSPTAFAKREGIAHTTLLRALKKPMKPKQGRGLSKKTHEVTKAFLEAVMTRPVVPAVFAAQHKIDPVTLRRALQHRDYIVSFAKAQARWPQLGPREALTERTRQLTETFLKQAAVQPISPAAFAAKNNIYPATLRRALRHPDYATEYQSLTAQKLVARARTPLAPKLRHIVGLYYQQQARGEDISRWAFAKLYDTPYNTLKRALEHPEAKEIKKGLKQAAAKQPGALQPDSLSTIMQSWCAQAASKAISVPVQRPPVAAPRRIVHTLDK